jgi:hypothetical protein
MKFGSVRSALKVVKRIQCWLVSMKWVVLNLLRFRATPGFNYRLEIHRIINENLLKSCKKIERGGACSAYGKWKCVQNVGRKTWREERTRGATSKWEGNNIKMNLRENKAWKCGLDAYGARYWPVAGSSEHGVEPMSYIKGGEFLN